MQIIIALFAMIIVLKKKNNKFNLKKKSIKKRVVFNQFGGVQHSIVGDVQFNSEQFFG